MCLKYGNSGYEIRVPPYFPCFLHKKISGEFFVPFCVFRRPPLNLEWCRSLALNYNCWVDYNLQARVGRMCCPL